jgi:hypothetical protein
MAATAKIGLMIPGSYAGAMPPPSAFNEFFLIYVTLFSLSILALIFGLTSIDARAISQAFRARTPVKWIAGYMVFIAAFLGGFWTAQTASFLVTGQLPQTIIDSGIHTSIVFALDLSLLVPGMVLGAIWLWQRRPWGYVLAALMMIKGTLYPMVLIGMAIFHARATGSWDALTLFWVFFAVASVIFAGLLFGNMKSVNEQDEPRHTQGVLGPEAGLSSDVPKLVRTGDREGTKRRKERRRDRAGKKRE